MTLDIVVRVDGRIAHRGWALNEASLEKGPRLGVLGVVLEVDRRPVSAFGCDGVLVSTPTGSTAYAFSAGGPILWPDLEAILVVPNNAHALFARPLVTSPDAAIAIEIEGTGHDALVFCDGRRDMVVPAGEEETRCGTLLKWCAWTGPVHRPSAQVPPASSRVGAANSACRDPDRGARRHQLRHSREFDRGLTVLTGRPGPEDHGGHRPAPARRCAPASRVRSGSERAVVEGRFHNRTRQARHSPDR
jgi:hypothetical protein